MKIYKTASFLYSNFRFLVLALLIVLSHNLSAQSKKATTPVAAPKAKVAPSPSESKQETNQENQEEINRNKEIDAKYQEIEKAGYSPEEKEKLKDELYRATGRRSPFEAKPDFANVNFKPRYIPTVILEKYIQTLKEAGENNIQNIVVVNNAISIDFNKINNPEIQNKLNPDYAVEKSF
jgi:hypothetical protein